MSYVARQYEQNGHEWTEYESTRFELPKTRTIHESTKEELEASARYYAACEKALDNEIKRKKFGEQVRSYAAGTRNAMESQGFNTDKIPGFLDLAKEALKERWPTPPTKEESGISPDRFHEYCVNDFCLGFYKLYELYK